MVYMMLYIYVFLKKLEVSVQLQILVKADNKCNESNATAKIVNSCPTTARDWNEAANRKGCRNMTHSCTSFEYHCVMNAWRNETIEVCAPSWSIVGTKRKKTHLNNIFCHEQT